MQTLSTSPASTKMAYFSVYITIFFSSFCFARLPRISSVRTQSTDLVKRFEGGDHNSHDILHMFRQVRDLNTISFFSLSLLSSLT